MALLQVDGTKLDATKGLRSKTFDIIVFNFPHAGTSAFLHVCGNCIDLIITITSRDVDG